MFPLIRRHVAKHPFLTASVVLHALLLTALFYAGTYKINQAALVRDQRLVDASMHEIQRVEMARRVYAISEMKKLMEQAGGGQGRKPDTVASGDKTKPPTSDKPEKPSPQELLKEAKELAESMQAMERKIKATELAALLKIPEEEALKKVDVEKIPPLPNNENSPKEDHVTAEIAAYEKIAGDILKRELARKDRQDNGTQVATAEGKNSDSHGKGGADGLDTGRGNGHGDGGDTNGSGSRSDSTALIAGFRSFGAYRPVLGIAPANLRKAGGRVIGADGIYATRITPDSWYLIGPFQARGYDSVNIPFPPERLIDLDGVYFGQKNRAVKWKYVQSDHYPIVPPGEPEDAVYYGYTELMLDQDRDLWVAVGADEDAKLWVNSKLVWSSVKNDKEWYHRDYRSMSTHLGNWNLTEENRLIHFKKGRNRILFKLYNAYGVLFFSFVIANSG